MISISQLRYSAIVYCEESNAIFDRRLPSRRSAIVLAANIARIAIAGPADDQQQRERARVRRRDIAAVGGILTVTISPA